jgi:hypothetical protein
MEFGAGTDGTSTTIQAWGRRMIQRDEQGRVVVTIEETDDELGMTITNGGTYRFHGEDYLATIEDSELATGTLACFQRFPINQSDDEPVMFLDRNDGSLSDDTGTNIGDYRDLEFVR